MPAQELRLRRPWFAAAMALAAAVATGCHQEESEFMEPSGPTLEAANAASKTLSDFFAANTKVLEGVLADVEKEGAKTPDLPAKLAASRAKLPDHAPLVVFDAKRQLVASDVGPEGLPPYKVVMPLLRMCQLTKKPVVTEAWLGNDKQYWVAQGRMTGEGDKALTAVTAYPLAGKTTAAMLASLQKVGAHNVQVLDDTGLATWSTKPEDRFKSAVHGTYLLDKIQDGKSFQTKCHDCHETDKHKIERSDVRITVVPVPGTKWSVSVR